MKLIDVLKPEFIIVPLKSTRKEDVIKELIAVLEGHDIFDNPESIFQAVVEREKIMTTGVGREVAIPHCKKQECKKFAIALGLTSKGIEFKSIDKKPVKIIFLLVGPEENPGMHIRLLSRISRLIAKEQLREKLLQVSEPDTAYTLLNEEEKKYFEIVS
jgi:fructose-specific phosphotransferase system IIA component